MDEIQLMSPAPNAEPPYRILFSIYSWYYFRHIRPIVEDLAEQGHRIHVASIIHDRDDFKASVDEVCETHANVATKSVLNGKINGLSASRSCDRRNAFFSRSTPDSTTPADMAMRHA